MRVVIDISRLHMSALKRGVGFYAKNLYRALLKLKDNNIYFFKKKRPEIIKADIVHFPYFDPFFLSLPLLRSMPAVVTIHDLIPIKLSQHFPTGIRGKIKWIVQKNLIKFVQAVITDSENSKKDINKYLGIPKNRIYPIYLAAEKSFKKFKIKNLKLKIKKKYSLPNTFLLYVGDLNWNKNLKALISVFKKLKIKNKKSPARNAFSIANADGKTHIKNQKDLENIKLVLVGKAFEEENLAELREIKNLIKKLDLEKDIKILGYVPTKDLVAIYNLANLYIQPSFYEGFGLPVLEALSCGCPVLCSNQASLPEVGGDAVEYFNPYKQKQFEKKLLKLLSNKKKLITLAEKGLKRAKQFSWEKTAIKTRAVYEKVLKQTR